MYSTAGGIGGLFRSFFSSLVDFLIGHQLSISTSQSRKKLLLFCSLGLNLRILFFFKYFNFFLDSFYEAFTVACTIAIKNGIKPVIVISPCFIDGQKSILNKKEIIATFNSFSSDGVLVLDFHNSNISKNKLNFYDNVHLNRTGSEKFTNQLIKELKECLQ